MGKNKSRNLTRSNQSITYLEFCVLFLRMKFFMEVILGFPDRNEEKFVPDERAQPMKPGLNASLLDCLSNESLRKRTSSTRASIEDNEYCFYQDRPAQCCQVRPTSLVK